MGLVYLLVFQVTMWFYAYKNEEGSIAAILVGFIFLRLVIQESLIPQVTDLPINTKAIIMYLYFGLSHLAYAIAIWNMSRPSWLYRYKK